MRNLSKGLDAVKRKPDRVLSSSVGATEFESRSTVSQRPEAGDIVIGRPLTDASDGNEENSVRDDRARIDALESFDLAPFERAVQAPLPATLSPQLAVLVDEVPHSDNWTYEIKFDGYRVLARVDDGDVRLYTRDGKDWTARLTKQVDAIRALHLKSAWLDGEVVVLDQQGISSFQFLQNAFSEKSAAHILFFLFDLPYLNGYDLRKVPLNERRSLLRAIVGDNSVGPLRFSAALQESPEKSLDNACLMSMEGIIGKKSDSVYAGVRSGDWIKLKCRKRQEFIIAGYTEPQGARNSFGALLLAVYDEDGELHYVGRVGTGFNRAILQSTYKELIALEQSECPFKQVPRGALFAPTHWLTPQLVAEISFAEWTQDGLLRQAVFHGLRLDKAALEIRREEPVHVVAASFTNALQDDLFSHGAAKDHVLQGVNISHPGRVIDPSSGLNKLDLARYYDYVAPLMLPFLKNRPVYLLRAPEGIESEHFFQRHNTRMLIPGVGTLDRSLDPHHEPLMVIDTAPALIGAIQMGTIELHTCNANANRIDQPDCMVFDLDPDPDLPWSSVVLAARLMRTVLDDLGLKNFLRTSGGKGLHVVVPLASGHPWEIVSDFSQAIAQYMARTIPTHFSAKMGARNRIGKTFIDYMRNQRQASTVAPYSVRARPGLPVATPIFWDELKTLTGPMHWTVRSLPKRLSQMKVDPWNDYFQAQQMLTEEMLKGIGGLKGSRRSGSH